MDKSKEYILMSACEEIQKLRDKPKWSWDDTTWCDGDYYCYSTRKADDYNVSIWCGGCDQERGPADMSDNIWLPRLDQLQEMLGFCGASDIYGWLVRVTLFQRDNPYQSGEQLWLAFVMKEKYSKQWLAESQEWVKI